jgi:hypothetical protein
MEPHPIPPTPFPSPNFEEGKGEKAHAAKTLDI